MTEPQNKNNGCLWPFLFGLFAFLGTIVLTAFTDLGLIFSFILSAIISVLLTIKLIGRAKISSLLKNILWLFFLVVGARFVLLSLLEYATTNLKEDYGIEKEEGVAKTYLIEKQDTIPVYLSHRVWKDNYGNLYRGDLTVREKDFLRLHNYLDTYRPSDAGNFWGKLYAHMAQMDGPSLDLIINAFTTIHAKHQLNQMEFAEMVVSCIQDIPYSFVFQTECLPAERYEESIRTLLLECPECCIGNKMFGIQNPVSFIQNLKGDCDTRTVLIYALLKHFNYDVAILNSDFYRHSIIGLNLPSSGDYLTHHGKKYAVWETTAKYYTVGQLPANFDDITHWNVILTSK